MTIKSGVCLPSCHVSILARCKYVDRDVCGSDRQCVKDSLAK